MKRKIITIIITTLCLITISVGFIYGWYIHMSSGESKTIQSEDIEGLELNLYRAYDYDFNGVIDSRDEYFLTASDEELESVKNDLNENFININYSGTRYDIITGIIDNNIITYRLVIKNNSDKELNINPYFIFSDDSGNNIYKHNSILFNLKGINQLNHTFKDKNCNLINCLTNGTESHFDVENKTFYKYDLSNGLYDTYMRPITKITDGSNIYKLEYTINSSSTTVNVYKNDSVNALEGNDLKVNLTKMYYSNAFDSNGNIITEYDNTTSIYDTYYKKITEPQFYDSTYYIRSGEGTTENPYAYSLATSYYTRSGEGTEENPYVYTESDAYYIRAGEGTTESPYTYEDSSYGLTNTPCNLEYNCYNNKLNQYLLSNIEDDVKVPTGKYWPSKYYAINKNLSCLMYNEKIQENIIIDSYSEYYLDYYVTINSNITALASSLEKFATLHNIVTTNAQTILESPYGADYNKMLQKYNEMKQYSEIQHPNFRIQNFCYDIKFINNYSSYFKTIGGNN